MLLPHKASFNSSVAAAQVEKLSRIKLRADYDMHEESMCCHDNKRRKLQLAADIKFKVRLCNICGGLNWSLINKRTLKSTH